MLLQVTYTYNSNAESFTVTMNIGLQTCKHTGCDVTFTPKLSVA